MAEMTPEYLLKLQHQAEAFRDNGHPVVMMNPKEVLDILALAREAVDPTVPTDHEIVVLWSETFPDATGEKASTMPTSWTAFKAGVLAGKRRH